MIRSLFSSLLCALIAASASAGQTSFPSLRGAMEGLRFGVRACDGGQGGAAHARNPTHGFDCRFDAKGLTLGVATQAGGVVTGRFQSGWSLAAIGRGPETLRTGTGVMRAKGQRAEILRTEMGITEWFINGPAGLEHGFDVRERPLAGREGLLRLHLAVEGDLMPLAEDGGNGISLRDRHGRHVARYDKLLVWDADGAEIPAALTCGEGFVTIEVDDAGARYPLVIDPLFSQEAFVKASNSGTGDAFGFSVAIAGDTAVVGAPNEDSNARGVWGNQGDNSAMDSGAAYVFVRANGVWTLRGYLKASNADIEDDFGYAVAIDGDTLAVGAPDEASGSPLINGNQADNSFALAGAVYVFTRDAEGEWSQQAYLKAANAGAGDRFGFSLALSGNTLVVGAPLEDSNATGVNGNGANNLLPSAGAAYVFVRSGTTWTQQAFLKASNPDISDTFGSAVAVSGDLAVVGAPGEDGAAAGVNESGADNSISETGAAYAFARSGTTWTQQAYLKAANPMPADQFGTATAASGERIAVGAPTEDGGGTGVNPPPGAAPRLNSGAAYVFARAGGMWQQEAYLKASNADESDAFGHSVALDASALAVGARREASAATGVGGDPSDNGAPSAGAVYVFERDDVAWRQRVYIKASNTGEGDEFGSALALSGDTLIAGAPMEDSNATGINGNGSTNNFSGSGAAYIITGIGSPPVPLPVLAVPEVDEAGDWTLRWSSTPGARYTLQRSQDLIEWTDVITLVADDETISHLEAAANMTEPTFWRVLSPCE